MWRWRVKWFSLSEVGIVLIVHKMEDHCHHVRVERNNEKSGDQVDFIFKLKHFKVLIDEAMYLKYDGL